MKKILGAALAAASMTGTALADGHAANIIVVTHGSDADGLALGIEFENAAHFVQ